MLPEKVHWSVQEARFQISLTHSFRCRLSPANRGLRVLDRATATAALNLRTWKASGFLMGEYQTILADFGVHWPFSIGHLAFQARFERLQCEAMSKHFVQCSKWGYPKEPAPAVPRRPLRVPSGLRGLSLPRLWIPLWSYHPYTNPKVTPNPP